MGLDGVVVEEDKAAAIGSFEGVFVEDAGSAKERFSLISPYSFHSSSSSRS